MPTSGILLPKLKLRLYILHAKYFLAFQYISLKSALKRWYLNNITKMWIWGNSRSKLECQKFSCLKQSYLLSDMYVVLLHVPKDLNFCCSFSRNLSGSSSGLVFCPSKSSCFHLCSCAHIITTFGHQDHS